ncbi:MAG: T9SS type A sorting domain-containing protein, partial [bacterium]
IIGKTSYFSPEIAGSGVHKMVYIYNYMGEPIETEPQTVEVLNDFDFLINGPQIVCINSTCSEYKIEDENLELYEFSWKVQGGQIIQNNQTSVFIEWEDNTPSGKISVTAELLEGNCKFTDEIIVHIKNSIAPPRSYPVFIDKDLKFLACSDINAKIFRWLKIVDGNEIVLGETYKPYFVHEAGAQEDEIFFVETAYEEESCFTRSYPCSFNNQWNSSICASLKSNFINEIKNQQKKEIEITVKKEQLVISASLNKNYQIDIYDLNGRKIKTSNLIYEETFLRSSFKPGNHIIIVSDKGKLVAKQQVRF